MNGDGSGDGGAGRRFAATATPGGYAKGNDGNGQGPNGATGTGFGYMFPDLLADPDNLLPAGPGTIAALRALGAAMATEDSAATGDGVVPAAYTYFGQFIDHDITKTAFSPDITAGLDLIEAHSFAPIAQDRVTSLLSNARTSALDLDSLYGGLALEATEPDGHMRLGKVTSDSSIPGPIAVATPEHDLPRRPQNPSPASLEEVAQDREALIGDPRNDENLIVGQLHVAFLRAHNALLDRLGNADEAKRALRRRYQWAALHDFVPRICGEAVYGGLVADGPQFFHADHPADLVIPLEFSGAAYRFGHSMIRQSYEHNSTFRTGGLTPATFNFMFTFTALSGDISAQPGPGGSPTLPDNWIIEWHRFFNQDPDDPASPSENPARKIDTHLALELARLPSAFGETQVNELMGRLAARNLLRGYLLGLPTGQAVAARMGETPIAPDDLRALVTGEALDLCEKEGLFDRTPLWFYVLAEAELEAEGQHLGRVGGTIVAETLWQMVRHSRDSVLINPPDADELATGEFTLRGIVKLGQDTLLPPL
ncbi:heme peroxidase family protein [Sphingomonas sp. IW22]|uniref:peroxidase family protein n=1 Tax=Sphingomonas sp. IW22 TaxID=3242489 RepID=UPI0035206C24